MIASAGGEVSLVAANIATFRVPKLTAAIDAIAALEPVADLHAAQGAALAALAVLYQLQDDDLKRNEWAQMGWSKAQTDLWDALIGVRHVGHHRGLLIVTLRGHDLLWDADVGGNDSSQGKKSYRPVLHLRPVVDSLRAVSTGLRL